MTPDESADIESTPPPAVSSLRSRFEKLAADSSVSIPQRPVSSHGLLTTDPPSPRPRASSGTCESRPEYPSLRAASSSSDLRRPPPPPPPAHSSRASSPAPPAINISTRPPSDPHAAKDPATTAHTATASASIPRKPPPPPPPLHSHPDTSANRSHGSNGVSSLVNKFGNISTPVLSPQPFKLSVASNRAASHSNVVLPSSSSPHPSTIAESRRPRHSFPQSPALASSPNSSSSSLASSESRTNPFSEPSDSETVSPDPPPLPSRPNAVSARPRRERNSSTEDPAHDGDVSTIPPPLPGNRPSVPVPPRPPPRPKPSQSSSTAGSIASSSASSTPSLSPPPLPARKTTGNSGEDSPSHQQPMRLHTVFGGGSGEASHSQNSSPMSERKAFGSHLPPPTRTIGLGDKLPPARKATSGSSSESEEDDSKAKVELLPDTSRSSRRPPILYCHKYSSANIHAPAYSSVVAVSGHVVAVAFQTHLKIYDLATSDNPTWNLDTREIGHDMKLKEFKVTSLEFRPAANEPDRGCCLWLGTKEGHLLELDVRTGTLISTKPAAHAHTVTHIFRHGRSMVTMDDHGKVLVFTPGDSEDEVHLAFTQPRVSRVAEKQDFAQLLDGQLWTSTRDPAGGGAAGTTSRGPHVRIYDVFTPGSSGKSVLPTEHLGTVTSGTVLASQRDKIYLGHEGGHVSVWSRTSDEGVPQCLEVIKVSTSDVLSLEGVNDRLWAGGRGGTISAFDVASRPWVATNSWQAHSNLPVLRIVLDTWSPEKLGKLAVYSVGRDERIRFWDGLLGVDWIDQELLKREAEFSSFRPMTALIVSWNVDSAKPDALTGSAENLSFFQDVLTSVDSPDIIAVGLQELIDLESRKMAAKTVLYGGKKKAEDGGISQKVTTSYKKWYDRLVLAVRMAMPPDTPYTVIHTESLVGLFTCIFVKNTERISLKHVAITTIKRGMGGRYGNKGGIVARFVIDDTSICFINCHLAAGQHHVRQRNADIAAMLEDRSVFPESDAMAEPLAYVNGGDGSMVMDHEFVFINGDMNYRIDQRRDAVIASLKAGDLEHLIAHDQLIKEMKLNRGFRARTFQEGPLTFAPTYKYDRRSSEYDTSEKARVPAWCDRVLWRSRDPSRVEQLHYRRYEANISDHRPISAGFRITIKAVNQEARARVKDEVERLWAAHERSLLTAALQFFIDEAMV